MIQTKIKERPILFSAPMVQAILGGRKTQTRRIIADQPLWTHLRVTPIPEHGPFYLDDRGRLNCKYISPIDAGWSDGMHRCSVISERGRVPKCPYGIPGDRLWVRESFWSYTASPRFFRSAPGVSSVEDAQLSSMQHSFTAYRADWGDKKPNDDKFKGWSPSIHMPRKLSRLLLEITEVRAQRLQRMRTEDALAEGVTAYSGQFDGCFGVLGTTAMSGTTAVECFSRLWDTINGVGSWGANPWVWVVSFKPISEVR